MSLPSRVCARCGRDLPADCFHVKSKATGQLHSKCKECSAAYSREHYRANRDAYIGRAKLGNQELRRRKRELVAELRLRPCADCGQTFPPCCMEFDHRQGREITGRDSPEAIANMKNSPVSLTRLIEEIRACDVICANCHAIRTHRRAVGTG